MKKFPSLKSTQEALRDGQTSCKEIVSAYLLNIDKYSRLNAFTEVYAEEALTHADRVDEKIKNGTAGKMAGLVVGLKDVLCHKGHRIQASSQILNGFESQFSATAVERLLAEDAIIIGRQNCDEFAMGSSNENSSLGKVLNGADESRVPGGSSGGSAVAVQMEMCRVSLGSDTGGSVRQPAAFCGVVGFKPTYSRISRHGLIAYASSFDTIGIFSENSEDAAAVLEVISGEDDFDSTASRRPVPKFTEEIKENPKKLRIAYVKETMEHEGLQPEVRRNTEKTIEQLRADGHEVEALEFDMLEYTLPVYYILTTAEASTNLSRFDGVRYGHRAENIRDLEEMYKKTRSEGFGAEVKRRIMLGTFVLSADYYDAYFTKAQRVRNLIRQKTLEMFEKYDFVISPTTPTSAFKIGEMSGKTIEMYLADLFTVHASIGGFPAVSIPNGTDNENLPIGLHLMSAPFTEGKLLAFAQYLQNSANKGS